MSSKELIKGSNITTDWLVKQWSTDIGEYKKAHRRAKRLDALDRGKLWEELKAKFPSYQLLPQTNHINYIKNNIVASIYTVGKSAQLLCTNEEDKEVIENLNIALDHIWSTRNVAYYELLAGERAALTNLGITQVGWDNNIISSNQESDNFEKGQVVLKNIDPLKYMRDPYAESLDTASHVVTWNDYHESVIAANPKYKEAFNKYKNSEDAANNPTFATAENVVNNTDRMGTACNRPGYYRVFVWYVRHDGKIAELHMLNNKVLLYKVDAIKPNMYPFAELYCNIPTGDLIGVSECAKVMDNSIVYNLMSSIIATSEYKNQRPPRFISRNSGINVNAFVKHGNEADKTFVVDGDASKAVHYHQYPQPTAASLQTMQFLNQDMQFTSGIDGRYTGRDTGSVLTTGGINSMLDQVTMIDTTKILLYEQYAKRLSKLIMYNYINGSTIPRKYVIKDAKHANQYKTIEVPFNKLPASIVFDYQLDISSEMPKNKARLAATADAMIEKQMQYQGAGVEVDLITPEEWLMMQDIPNKEYFQERMGIQKTQNWQRIVAQAVTQYAGLVEQGLNPTDAINATAQTLTQQSSVGAPDMQNIAQNTQLF